MYLHISMLVEEEQMDRWIGALRAHAGRAALRKQGISRVESPIGRKCIKINLSSCELQSAFSF